MKIAPFKVEEFMNKYEANAVFDLTTTCIKPLTINELCPNIKQEVFNIPLGYGDITGSENLKKEISSLYTNQDLRNITVTHGAIGANQLVFNALLEKDDEVVCIVPVYQQHYSIPESIGARVRLYFLKEENNWLPDIDDLKKIISSKTKLLCINTPNNPTGAVIPNWLLEEIVKIAQYNNVWILSDEVYRGLNLIGNPYSLSVADIYDKGISVGSMSKTYSLPGLRVGWICAREDLINEVNHHRQYNTISISILDDYFAAYALKNRGWISERNFSILKNGHDIFTDWLSQEELVSCIIPTGGTTALIKYHKKIPSLELCKKLYNIAQIAILPGETMEMEGFLRIGLCANNLKPALSLFSEFLKRV